ncbi:MAG: lysophospholipase [Spirochaeta sp.]|jgi:acylglycerol lipase|nr:lysophospholipase [Spirochaeta sp.]
MESIPIVEDFFSGVDGRRLFVRHAAPEKTRAVVILLHGYGEHGGRYLETMDRLANAGFAVYCPDHRGFGKSEVTPGDIEGVDLVTGDIHALSKLTREQYPGDSTILIGHSMGGMLALNQLLHHEEEYDLAVVSGPAVLPPPDTHPLVAALAGVVARIAPRLPVQKLDLSRATRDPEMKARDDADHTMYRGKVLARTGHEILKTQQAIRAGLDRITIPLLLLHGGDDTIISPDASAQVYAGIASTERERVVFPGLYHEVFNEPERDEVFSTMFRWIDSVLQNTEGV